MLVLAGFDACAVVLFVFVLESLLVHDSLHLFEDEVCDGGRGEVFVQLKPLHHSCPSIISQIHNRVQPMLKLSIIQILHILEVLIQIRLNRLSSPFSDLSSKINIQNDLLSLSDIVTIF